MYKTTRTMTMLALLAGTFLLSPAQAQLEGSADEPTPVAADTMYVNARVRTPDGWKTGLAVAGETIVAVGSEQELAAYRTPKIHVVDLGGATVLPGLVDMHVHAVSAGLDAANCRFRQGSKPAEIIETVKACVARAKPGSWIVGGQWDGASFGTSAPHRALLDRIAPNNPVLLRDVSLHSAWVNGAALAAGGITRDTPNPDGGIIEKDKAGNPTGILRERAAMKLLEKVPQPDTPAMVDALRSATRTMLSLGITSYEDALLTTPAAKAYAALADAGELYQHVRTCMWEPDQALIASRNLYARPGLEMGCVKMMLDGVPTDAHTAAMHDDYADTTGVTDPARRKGLLLVAPDQISAKLTRYDAAGLTVKLHATGDAAVHAALDGIEAARKANGITGMRHEIAHANFVLPADFARAGAIGATFEFSPYVWFPNSVIKDVIKAVGPTRMEHFSPVKSALDAALPVTVGSDWPVVPAADPWLAMETLVTRQAPGGVGDPISPQERISVAQAVDLFTRAAARQLGIGDRAGSIERGKRADLIVIDRDIFAIPATDIHNTKVLRTIISGKERYTRP
ncbi:amidohydrolase [Rhizorhabdus histidinilytica]|uniref:amidohydrolase n=1 Tax=Rhizorhabdus histidinilytica TaxID=439228 RepID=UPI00321FF2BA